MTIKFSTMWKVADRKFYGTFVINNYIVHTTTIPRDTVEEAKRDIKAFQELLHDVTKPAVTRRSHGVLTTAYKVIQADTAIRVDGELKWLDKTDPVTGEPIVYKTEITCKANSPNPYGYNIFRNGVVVRVDFGYETYDFAKTAMDLDMEGRV